MPKMIFPKAVIKIPGVGWARGVEEGEGSPTTSRESALNLCMCVATSGLANNVIKNPIPITRPVSKELEE